MVVQLSIPLGNIDALLGVGFTHIEIHHSRDEGRSFEEITRSAASPATLLSLPAQTLFELGGKRLRLKVDGAGEVEIIFSPLLSRWSPAQVVARIEEQLPGAASVEGSQVRLQGMLAGRGGILEVTYSDALSLGWLSGVTARGVDARLVLTAGKRLYSHLDVGGHQHPHHRYRYRLSANGAAPRSDFSANLPMQVPQVVDPAKLSFALANFVGVDGRAQRRTVIVASEGDPHRMGDLTVGNETPLVYESDAAGYLAFPILRGARIRVALEGTSLVRLITVPDAETFDLLQAMKEAPDPYSVQTVAPLLSRRSLS
jgi:hypothetical protein